MIKPRKAAAFDLPYYTDGIIEIVEVDTAANVSSFSAPLNVVSSDVLKTVVTLPYERMSHREQDLEFAERTDHTLDLKVKVPNFPGKLSSLTVAQNAVIEGTLFSIYQKDISNSGLEAYLYMEEVRTIA